MSGAILETEALLEGSKNKNLEEQVSSSDGDEQVTDDDDDDGIIEINDTPVDPQIISSGISLNISSAPSTDCTSQRSSWSMVQRYPEALTKYFTSLHRYEVFLSFRGSDTRKAFTDHLYTALVRASIQTFRDECDLEKGENIKSELYKAIEESRIAIIVFSKEYASSEWCLDELVRILERKKTTGLKVLPVFYDVQPSQIRNHSKNLGKAFSKTEQMDKVQEWKTALKEVADLGGMVLQNEFDGHESKFIQEVVAHVKSKLNGEATNRLTFEKLQRYISGTLGIVFLVFFFYMSYPGFMEFIKFRKNWGKFGFDDPMGSLKLEKIGKSSNLLPHRVINLLQKDWEKVFGPHGGH
ncbi:hypothetical protein LguiB_024155 [Lonicera macranthoides]